jgi:aromatic ring-opening dioxygenase catalytic subunit (LigB family)
MTSGSARRPTYYIPHGGGPWPFMPERAAGLESLTAFLTGLLAGAEPAPRAIVVVSGHWEEPLPTVSARSDYSMLYDYYGFPENTYALQYPAPGSPEVAGQVAGALGAAGFRSATEHQRGYDHGVFVPFMLVAPEATIPVVPLSLIAGLDPAQHIAMGRALAPLRDDDVLIVGSGMSFHNLRALYAGADVLPRSQRFDTWLNDAATDEPAHPREEHLLPLMVAAGAAACDRGRRVYNEAIMGAVTSGFRFG